MITVMLCMWRTCWPKFVSKMFNWLIALPFLYLLWKNIPTVDKTWQMSADSWDVGWDRDGGWDRRVRARRWTSLRCHSGAAQPLIGREGCRLCMCSDGVGFNPTFVFTKWTMTTVRGSRIMKRAPPPHTHTHYKCADSIFASIFI